MTGGLAHLDRDDGRRAIHSVARRSHLERVCRASQTVRGERAHPTRQPMDPDGRDAAGLSAQPFRGDAPEMGIHKAN